MHVAGTNMGSQELLASTHSVTNVECIGVKKRTNPNKHFVYVLNVSWSDGVKHPVYRTYTTFFDLQSVLKEQCKDLGNITVPTLPALKSKGFFVKESSQEKRKKDINLFCQQLFRLPEDIISSQFVTSFFETWFSDFAQLPQSRKISEPSLSTPGEIERFKDRFSQRRISQPITDVDPTSPVYDGTQRRTTSPATLGVPYYGRLRSTSLDLSDSFPGGVMGAQRSSQSLPRGMDPALMEEEEALYASEPYRVIMSYKSQKNGEVDLDQGNIVDVIERSLSGWWFVHVEGSQAEGWAPGAFLEPLTKPRKEELIYEEIPFISSGAGLYKATCDYHAQSTDEVSYKKGDSVEVLQSSLDGWWKVRCNGKDGVTPAMNLEKIEKEEDKKKGASSLFHRKSIYRRGPPPRRSTRKDPSSAPVYAQVNKPKKKSSVVDPAYEEVRMEVGTPAVLVNPPVPARDEGAVAAAAPLYAQVNKAKKNSRTREYEEIKVDNVGNPVMVESEDEEAPTYAKVNKLRKDSSKAVDQVDAAVNAATADNPQDAVTYTEICFNDGQDPSQSSQGSSGPVTSPDAVQYSTVVLQLPKLKHKTADNPKPKSNLESHTYENMPPAKLSPHYENVNPADLALLPGNNISETEQSGVTTNGSGSGGPSSPSSKKDLLCPPVSLPDSPLRTTPSEEPPQTAIQAVPRKTSPVPQPSPRLQKELLRQPVIHKRKNTPSATEEELVGNRQSQAPPSPSTSMPPPLTAPGPGSPQHSPVLHKKPGSEASSGAEGWGFENEAWFVGKMSRQQSETLLMHQGQNRDFLIRESTNRVGDFTLSVRYEDRVRHFPIQITAGQKYYIGKHHFKDLNKVIQYYGNHPLFYDDKKNPVSLGTPIEYGKGDK